MSFSDFILKDYFCDPPFFLFHSFKIRYIFQEYFYYDLYF